MEAIMKIRASAVAAVLLSGLATSAIAADLPQSGSFKLHTGFKSISEATQVAENHTLVGANSWGVSFNDAGNGPLHTGPVMCKSITENIEGVGAYQGKCAWGDSDGDKIFTDSSGKSTSNGLVGTGTITGGTGKFAGIHGKTAFQCKPLSPPTAQAACNHQFDYELTATGTSTPKQ
jgi:hypothetical protein